MSRYGLSALVITALFAVILFLMGQPAICECSYVKLWHGEIFSPENSQHIADWYTFSHVIHGVIFYWILSFLFPKWSVASRFLAAFSVEAGWEIFENTDFIINRYRETALALDYYGDSIVNSSGDLFAAAFSFSLAWRLPVWASVSVVIFLELAVLHLIRDNLTLNIIMLTHPFEFIQNWQAG